nr:immunoglobulin heavy chain junction region [Macaca mulatta]
CTSLLNMVQDYSSLDVW